jgi:TolB protein
MTTGMHMTTPSRRYRPGSGIIALAAALSVAVILTAQQPPQSSAPQTRQPDQVVARITGASETAPPHYAVPDFIALSPSAEATAKLLAQVLWDDLSFERVFDMIPRDIYKSIPVARTADRIPFANWREVGADGVFFGTVDQKGNDIVVQIRLFNVRTQAQVFGQEYTIAARSARRIAHEVADTIHEQQGGVRGVARTRLTFVSDRIPQSVLGTVEKRNAKEIWVVDYDGANELRITNSRDLNLNPSWSHDAKAIVYSAYRRGGAPDLFMSFITTGVLQDLTKGRFSRIGGASLPVVSPDGKQVAFSATPAGADAPDLFVMNIDGTNVRQLTRHPDSDTTPTWSPSGTQIAFTSDRLGPRPQIFIMNVDGSGTYRLNIPDAEADRATWAPAPFNEIAYYARTGPGYDIKVHDLATGQTRQLTFGEGSNESPAYSPSGRHIAFTSTRSGLIQVFTIGRDGNGLRQVTRSGNNQTPDWSN